jgi:glutaredoxin 2
MKTTKQQALEAALREIQGLNKRYANPTYREMQLERFARDFAEDIVESEFVHAETSSTFQSEIDALLYGIEVDNDDLR